MQDHYPFAQLLPHFPGNFSTSWTISTKSMRTVGVLEMLKTFDHQIQLRLDKFNGHLLPLLISHVASHSKNNSKSRLKARRC